MKSGTLTIRCGEALVQEVKIAAAKEGKTMQEWVTERLSWALAIGGDRQDLMVSEGAGVEGTLKLGGTFAAG